MRTRIFIFFAWGVLIIGLVVAFSAFTVPQSAVPYNRGDWMQYAANPPGYEYVP